MPVTPYSPPWFEHAKKDYKLAEIKGGKHNPRIIEMHAYTKLGATDDETPWCSSAMNAWLIESGFAAEKSAAAISWEKYGVAVKQNSLLTGDIIVFKRGTGWQRHVALYAGQRRRYNGKDQVLVLGGNQKNAVNYQFYDVDKITAIRRPKGYSPPMGIAATNVKPLAKSKTLAAAGISTAGTALLSTDITGVSDKITSILNKVDDLSGKVDKVANGVGKANDVFAKAANYIEYLPYIGIGLLALGVGLTIYSRFSDRWKGLN